MNKLSKDLTLSEVRLIIDGLKQETKAIYDLVPQSKIEKLQATMDRLRIRVIK
jgi:hypothetical protein